MSEEDINNLKEMLVDFNEYSTDYTKTRCKELEKTIENTLKEVERLKKQLNDEIDDELKQSEIMAKQQKEIERLNNIIKDIKSQLDYLETYSSKEDVFEDMKRRLDRIDKIIGSDKE